MDTNNTPISPIRIFKYKLSPPEVPGRETIVRMPARARVLSVGAVGDDIFVWALVGEDSEMVDEKFYIYPTGFRLSPSVDFQTFLGTVQMYGGSLVFHVFK